MEVAVPETQKKIFRARKTMKMSDRQQLETLHNTLAPSSAHPPSSSSSSQPPTPLVNGTHAEDGPKGAEKGKEKAKEINRKELPSATPASPAARSPPLSLSLSRTPSPSKSQSANSSPPASLRNESEKSKSGEKAAEAEKRKEEQKASDVEAKSDKKEKMDAEDTRTKPQKTPGPLPPVSLVPTATPEKKEGGTGKGEKAENGGVVAMDTDDPPVAPGPAEATVEEKREKTSSHRTSSSSSSSSSPLRSAGLESDPEVKEGFLCLSEEEDNQGERDDAKEKEKEKEKKKEKEGETDKGKMDVDAAKKEAKEKVAGSPRSSSPSTSGDTGPGDSAPSGKKRTLPEDGEEGADGEREGKRLRVDGVELEAQLELKITAKAGSRLKLEKMVQQLVEERLRVLQLTVFDRSLQELRERVEKIDCATKHQTTLNTLQAKISRLAKKFGAANQATENTKKAQEALAAASAKTTPPTNTTTPVQRMVRPAMDPKPTNQTPGSVSITASPAQPKPLPAPATPTSTTLTSPILQIIATTTGATPGAVTLSAAQAQAGTLLLKAAAAAAGGGVVAAAQSPGVPGGAQPMSLQPQLLIQLPISMANAPGGPGGMGLISSAGGMGLIPVSSLVSSLSKTKTTATTTFILQQRPLTATSASPATASQISLARAVYPAAPGGGSSMVSSPSAGVSVMTVRAPAQCAAVVGVASGALPATSVPAATGSAAAAGPATAMASKTDNQATSSTPTKTPAQPARAKSSFIDLTEDDDDVQVTGVKKATVQSPAATTTQRPAGPPPPLISTPTGSTARASPQGPQLTVHHRPPLDSPSRSRPGSSSALPAAVSSSLLPPLPSAPPAPARLPPEASLTAAPQQPQLKLARVQSQNGIVLSWCVAETDRNCAAVDSYHLYAYHQEHAGATATGAPPQSLWKKIGEVKALPLPMACTLTQFVSGSTYYFAVRAKDVYGRFGPFCEPQCTDVIHPTTS